MSAFVPDPDSSSQLFLQQILARLNCNKELLPDAQLRCLEHLEKAEKLVLVEVMHTAQATYAATVLKRVNLESQVTCLSKKI